MLMKLGGGALSFALVRSVWLRLPPSQLVQFNRIRFSISNRLAINISVQDFVNW
jgi:hypothetical protein